MEGEKEKRDIEIIKGFLFFTEKNIAVKIDEIRSIYPSGDKASTIIRFKNLSDNKVSIGKSVSEIVNAIRRGR